MRPFAHMACALAAAAVPGAPTVAQDAFVPNHLFVTGKSVAADGAAVFEFAPDGTHVRTIALTSGDGLFAYGLAFGPDGRLYVGDHAGGRVFVVAPDGDAQVFVDVDAGLSGVDGLTFGPDGTLWVCSRFTAEIAGFDRSGEPLGAIAGEGDEVPAAVTFAPDGGAWVTTGSDGKVATYATGFERIGSFGDEAVVDFPGNLAVGPDGYLWLGDCSTSTIHVFDESGDEVDVVADAALDCPYGLAFGPDGRLYAADFGSEAVAVLDGGGALVASIVHADMARPTYVAFAPFRFVARVQALGTSATGGAPLASKDKQATLSLAPGSGTILLAFDDEEVTGLFGSPWLALRGFDALVPDATKRIVTGSAAFGRLRAVESVSLGLRLKGKLDAHGCYVVGSAAGAALHVGRAASSRATVRTGKLVK